MKYFKQLFIQFLYLAKLDIMADKVQSQLKHAALYRLNRKLSCTLRFVDEGGGDFAIAGDLSKYSIDKTSYIKNGCYIECNGGVTIGRYCHLSREVTIFSSTHEYDSRPKIPYDEVITPRPVVIKDFVWVGSHAIILGGVTIGEGAIIGAGSVVIKDVPDYAIVFGNPGRVVGHRDVDHFNKLKEEKKFY